MTQRDLWNDWKAPETLKENVKMFFEFLDKKEYSDMSDTEFHPNKFDLEDRTIGSCRVWDTHRLSRVMAKMKELANEGGDVSPPCS